MTPSRSDASGFLTIQFVLVVAFTLLLLVLAANLIAWQYGRGVVRAALDEGARAGARLPVDAAICEQRARDAVSDLLGGTMGDGVDIRCWIEAGTVVAEADVTFSSWVDPVPDWRFTTRAIAVGERIP